MPWHTGAGPGSDVFGSASQLEGSAFPPSLLYHPAPRRRRYSRTMPTIAAPLDRAFRDAIRSAFDLEADPLIAVAQNDKFGDYQSNAAMGLAKVLQERLGQ